MTHLIEVQADYDVKEATSLDPHLISCTLWGYLRKNISVTIKYYDKIQVKDVI